MIDPLSWKWVIIVTLINLKTVSNAMEMFIEEDQKVMAGDEAELRCEISNTRGDIDECFWESPSRDKYYSSDGREDGVRVRLKSFSDDEYECILNIRKASLQHAGHWECVASDRRESVGMFGFVKVYDKSKFQVLLDSDQKQIVAERGNNIELVCPTNERFSRRAGKHSTIKLCRWYPPYDQKDPKNIVDVHGTVHNYKEDRIEASDRQIDDGQCGIIVKDLKFKDFGPWRCHILRRAPFGFGSQSTEATINVVRRPERLTKDKDDDFDPDEPMLQGYRRNDRDVRITLNVTVDKEESFTDFFWVIQRKYIVYEGEEECPDDENGNCYVAKRRRRVRGGKKNEYQMHLIIDKLSRDDLKEPVVLIKDYEIEKTRKELFELQFVPKFAPIKDYDSDEEDYEYFDEELPDYDNDDDDSTEVFDARDRTSFSRKIEDDNCIINRERVKEGESISYPRL